MDTLQANQRRDRSIVVSEQAHPHSDHTTHTRRQASPGTQQFFTRDLAMHDDKAGPTQGRGS